MEDNIDPDFHQNVYETSQQMAMKRHLKNSHLRGRSSTWVVTCSGIHPPRTEEAEREWKTL